MKHRQSARNMVGEWFLSEKGVFFPRGSHFSVNRFLTFIPVVSATTKHFCIAVVDELPIPQDQRTVLMVTSSRLQLVLPTNRRRLGPSEYLDAEDVARQHPNVGRNCNFPSKFYDLMEFASRNHQGHLISWTSDGTAFDVWNPDGLMDEIAAKIFPNQTTFRSLERQLSNWGFSREAIEETGQSSSRLKKGLPLQIRIAHPHFRRDMPNLLPAIQRLGGKATRKTELRQRPRGRGGTKTAFGLAGSARDVGASTGFMFTAARRVHVQCCDDLLGRQRIPGGPVDRAKDTTSGSHLAQAQQDSRATADAFDLCRTMMNHGHSSVSRSNLLSGEVLVPMHGHRFKRARASHRVETDIESPAFMDSDVGMGHGKKWNVSMTSKQVFGDGDEFVHNFNV